MSTVARAGAGPPSVRRIAVARVEVPVRTGALGFARGRPRPAGDFAGSAARAVGGRQLPQGQEEPRRHHDRRDRGGAGQRLGDLGAARPPGRAPAPAGGDGGQRGPAPPGRRPPRRPATSRSAAGPASSSRASTAQQNSPAVRRSARAATCR